MYLEKWYYVYIMTNRSRTLYTGVTGNIRQRVYEHKVGVAIAREKQLKRWTKIKKIRLIVNMNPTWKDLAEDWFPELKEQKKKTNA
jgi:putative endonuclease